MFTNILNQVFLMFVLVGIGFILNKIQFLHKETGSDLTNILLYVISPALILKSMQQDRSSYSLKIIALVVIALVILYFIAILLSNASFSHLHSLDMKRSAIMGTVYSNIGFVGIPIASALFGDRGVFYSAIGIMVYNTFVWTHGMTLFDNGDGSSKEKLLKMFKNPNTIAIGVGLVLFFSGVRLPTPLNQGLGYLAGANTPLSMFLIGNSLANIAMDRKVVKPWMIVTVFYRNLLMPVIGVLIFALLGIKGIDYFANVILFACPIGSLVTLFIIQAKGNPEFSIIEIGLSIVTCIISIPVIYLIAQLVMQQLF